jgi:outer membrane protein OmpA-like peptidoglycan-associated protein
MKSRKAFVVALSAGLFIGAAAEAQDTTRHRQSNVTADDLIEQLVPRDGALGSAATNRRGLAISTGEPATAEEPAAPSSSAAPGELPRVALEVRFAFDSARLTPQARRQLTAVAEAISSGELRGYAFLLEGHTDAVGPAAYNRDLSRRRAQAAYDYLVDEHGVAPARLSMHGHGESRPLNAADPAAAVNRRVEITNLGRTDSAG